MEKNCGTFVFKKLCLVKFLGFIWSWTSRLKNFLDYCWTWTGFSKFMSGSDLQNMSARSSLLCVGHDKEQCVLHQRHTCYGNCFSASVVALEPTGSYAFL